MTPRSPEVETQLASMAAAADRANRPAAFVAVPVLLLLVALVATVWAITEFNGARVRWSNRAKSVSDINQMMFRVKDRKAGTPDIDTVYPENRYMSPEIRDIALRVWGEEQGIPLNIGGKTPPSPFSGTSVLGRSDVIATGAVQDLDKLFQWMNAVPDGEFLKRSFVSHLRIQPAGPQWQVTVQFSLYEKLRG